MSAKEKKVSLPKKEGVSIEEAATEYMLDAKTMGAMVIDGYSNGVCNQIDMEFARGIIEESAETIKRGDLSKLEEMLYAQAMALNLMFVSLSRRASIQNNVAIRASITNLALKSQNQSKNTLQTLINLKQPNSTQFIKQANISQGHQQVNNLAEKNQISQNKLLGGQEYDLDGISQAKTKGIDSNMEAVGKVHRGKNGRGQGKGI